MWKARKNLSPRWNTPAAGRVIQSLLNTRKCSLDQNTRIRPLKKVDDKEIYKLLGGDPQVTWIIEDFGLKELNTLQATQKWIKIMLHQCQRKRLVPLVVETFINGEWNIIGLCPYAINKKELRKRGEIETMVIFGAEFRGKGFHQAVMYERLLMVIELKLIPTMWVNLKNQRSIIAVTKTTRMEPEYRTYDRKNWAVFCFTHKVWLDVKERIRERYNQKVTINPLISM